MSLHYSTLTNQTINKQRPSNQAIKKNINEVLNNNTTYIMKLTFIIMPVALRNEVRLTLKSLKNRYNTSLCFSIIWLLWIYNINDSYNVLLFNSLYNAHYFPTNPKFHRN